MFFIKNMDDEFEGDYNGSEKMDDGKLCFLYALALNAINRF